MPHDKNGNKLHVGDEVLLRGKIVHLGEGEEYCNLTIEIPPMHPRTEMERLSAINTRQVELVPHVPKMHAADELEPPPNGPDGGPA